MTMSAKVGIGAVVLVIAFLLGYVPASLTARAERAERDRLQRTVAVSEIQIHLGMMSYEANRDNYGLAAQLATVFFDRVRAESGGPADQEITMSLQSILARRDEITSDLAQASPAVKAKIAEMYADLFRLRQAPAAAPPVVSP